MTALLRRLTRRTPRQSCVALDPLLALLAAFEANAWDWHAREGSRRKRRSRGTTPPDCAP